jgi:hypothetical protein
MKIYAVIIEDSHTNVEVRIFSSAERALKVAREIFDDQIKFIAVRGEDIYWREGNEAPEGWLCDAVFSVEGDGLRVEELEVEND